MNIELDEVVQDVSDDALELAAGGAQAGLQNLGVLAVCRVTTMESYHCYFEPAASFFRS